MPADLDAGPSDWAAVLKTALGLYRDAEVIERRACQVRDFFPSLGRTGFNARAPSPEFQRGDTRSLGRQCGELQKRLDALLPRLREFVDGDHLPSEPLNGADDQFQLRYGLGGALLGWPESEEAPLSDLQRAINGVLAAARADKKQGRLAALSHHKLRWEVADAVTNVTYAVGYVAGMWCIAPLLAPSVPRRGRPHEGAPEHQRWFDAWKSGAYRSIKDLAAALRQPDADVRRIIERLQTRERRQKRAEPK